MINASDSKTAVALGPRDALDALVVAERSRAAVQRGSRWITRYLGIYAVATLVCFPALGLFRDTATSLFASCLWTAVVLSSAWYMRRQRVAVHGFRRAYALAFGSWTLLWIVPLTLGLRLFVHQPAYWAGAAVLVALPQFVRAWITAR